MRNTILSVSMLALSLAAQPALSEDLSDAEILQRFLDQRDAFQEMSAPADKKKGKVRGLVIIDLDAEEAGGADTSVADSGGATEGTTEVPGTETGDAQLADAGNGTGPAVDSTAPGLETPSTDGDGGVTLTEANIGDTPEGGATPEVITASAPDLPLDPSQIGILPQEHQVNVRISFDYDSATIQPDQVPVIEQMCRVILASDINLFRIMGHTDAAGSDDYNKKLSLLRAEEVKRQLVGCGVAPDRLDAMGLGEQFLSDPDDPRSAKNRRVEFQAIS